MWILCKLRMARKDKITMNFGTGWTEERDVYMEKK